MGNLLTANSETKPNPAHKTSMRTNPETQHFYSVALYEVNSAGLTTSTKTNWNAENIRPSVHSFFHWTNYKMHNGASTVWETWRKVAELVIAK